MTTWCCITPERVNKTKRLMDALEHGWPEGRVCYGAPPNLHDPFITWGQIWLAETLIHHALTIHTPFYQIDNAYYKAARGGPVGYYRFMYSRPDPVFLNSAALRAERMASSPELRAPFTPWRKTGKHVLVAMPGPDFGKAFGIDCRTWSKHILERVEQATDRPIKVRDRFRHPPLEEDLVDCWALVTHSSNVAVDAVLAGIPAFVEFTSMTAPLGNLSLSRLENPEMIPRAQWWASLMCQQFTIDEMHRGTAHYYLSAVAAQVDGAR